MQRLTLLLTALASTSSTAFVAPAATKPFTITQKTTSLYETAAEKAEEVSDEPEMNPDNPNLPALKGDYDWDAEYAADSDWITENVPGKIVVGDVELAAQVTALSKIEEKYRKVRQDEEYTEARIIGWVPKAEIYNSRFAMFFLAVGLLTEYWTGITIPGQIEEMARVGGFIGPDF
mmetsp:Transcript_29869/g.46258  ORF Transcript_29869/g.46258 Transcript_29869/m.46258 type:complete len:176 (+) Transcript_29869:136-663(+)